ncbi:MAG TPA: hypothetical protein VGC30_08510 [Dokdonella sp.]
MRGLSRLRLALRLNARTAAPPPRRCAACAHFDADPRSLEAAFGGLRAMGSGYASVRGGDGLCGRRQRYVAASSTCADFAAESAHATTLRLGPEVADGAASGRS